MLILVCALYTRDEILILGGKAWEIWMQDLSTKASRTKEAYVRGFKKFLERWEVEPEELYAMRVEDLSSEDTRDHLRIERMVRTQMAEIQESGLSAESSKMIMKALQSFFESMNLELRFKKKDSPKGSHNGQRAVNTELVVAMYDNMVFGYKLRNRAILLGLKDTGLRISDLGALSVGEYLRAKTVLNEARETFRVFEDPEETQKMKIPAYIHLGPESVAAIDEYLQSRRDEGEELTPDRPLFIQPKKTKAVREKGDRITKSAFTGIFDRLKKWLPNGGHKISAHSIRKFHRTRLEGAGMPESWVKKLQGKKASVYSQPEHTGELTQKYIQCYNALRIFGEQASVKKIDDQAEQIKELRQKLETALANENKVAESMNEMLAMRRKIEELSHLEKQVEKMAPAFAMIQRMIDREKKLDTLRQSP